VVPAIARRLIGAVFCLWALAPTPGAAQCERPVSLRFALVPAQDAARELGYYRPILDLLSANAGRRVELFLPSSYGSLIDALVAKRVDVAVLGPESYVMAHRKAPSIQVFGTYWRKSDGVQQAGPGYQSLLITRKGSAFTTIESLKDSTLALVDPASTSGAMIPGKIFPKEQHLPSLQDYFQQVTFSGGHDASAMAVATGKVDAAFVASNRFMEAVNSGKVALDQFNIVWTSPQIPLDPFVVRATLCDDLKAAITTTFLTADRSERGRAFLDNIHSERIVPMVDSDYDIIRSVGK